MKLIETSIHGVFILDPKVHKDERGYFFEVYNKSLHKTLGLQHDFVQDNESFSAQGVLRGLHYQVGEYAQTKLVRVIIGKVKDIIIDIRESSPTYGESVSVILSEENKRQLLVPRGFAHGFIVLSESALFSYKCDNYYSKESEGYINPLCNVLDLDWGMDKKKIKLSHKDQYGPSFGDHRSSVIKF